MSPSSRYPGLATKLFHRIWARRLARRMPLRGRRFLAGRVSEAELDVGVLRPKFVLDVDADVVAGEPAGASAALELVCSRATAERQLTRFEERHGWVRWANGRLGLPLLVFSWLTLGVNWGRSSLVLLPPVLMLHAPAAYVATNLCVAWRGVELS